MKLIIVDTNALIRFILNDVPGQVRTVELLLLSARDGKTELYIPQIVIFEIEFTLRRYYSVTKNDIINKLSSLVSMDYFQVQDRATLQRALKLFSENNLSLPDCFLVSLAEQKNADIFTFDKALKRKTNH